MIGSNFTNNQFILVSSSSFTTNMWKLADLNFQGLNQYSSFPFSFYISVYVGSILISSHYISISGYYSGLCSQTCQMTLYTNNFFFLAGATTYSTIVDGKMQILVQNAKIVLHSFSPISLQSISFSATAQILNSWASSGPSNFSQSLSSLQLPRMCGRCRLYAAYVNDSNTRNPQACFNSSPSQLLTEDHFMQRILSTTVAVEYTSYTGSPSGLKRSFGGRISSASNFACKRTGQKCASATECCSTLCSNGVCWIRSCSQSGSSCTLSDQCCSNYCWQSSCSSTDPVGSPCSTGSTCTSGICIAGVCSTNQLISFTLPPISSITLDQFASPFLGTSSSDSILLQFGSGKSLTGDILTPINPGYFVEWISKTSMISRSISSIQPFELDLRLPNLNTILSFGSVYSDVPWSVEENLAGQQNMFFYGLSSKRTKFRPIIQDGVGISSIHLSQLDAGTRTIISQIQFILAQEGPYSVESRGDRQLIAAFGSVAGAAGAIFAIFTIVKKVLTNSWKIYKPEDATESHWNENLISSEKKGEDEMTNPLRSTVELDVMNRQSKTSSSDFNLSRSSE